MMDKEIPNPQQSGYLLFEKTVSNFKSSQSFLIFFKINSKNIHFLKVIFIAFHIVFVSIINIKLKKGVHMLFAMANSQLSDKSFQTNVQVLDLFKFKAFSLSLSL
jgi:hypothetical protein